MEAAVTATGVRPGTNEIDIPRRRDRRRMVRRLRPARRRRFDGAGRHVDWAGRPAVFYDLVELPLGDDIVVTDERGRAHRFVVTSRASHPKGQLPPDLFRRSGPPVLTLITCGGSFDEDARSYRENVVVEEAEA